MSTSRSTSPSTSTVPPGSVVVGIDDSHSCAAACRWAVEQASLERRALVLAHGGPGSAAECLARARTMVATSAPELEVHEVISEADPRDLLLDLSVDAAVVAIGSRGRGPARHRRLLGPVGLAVLRAARCPVVVHPPLDSRVHRRGVLVGADGATASTPVVEFAFRQASLRGLPITVLHCRSAPDRDEAERGAMTQALTALSEKYPEVVCQVDVSWGAPAQVLREMGGPMHLVVVGSRHGTAPPRLLFGSVAASVVEHAVCPIAVVPA